jgi:SAM-dependent methyltransferase
MQRWFADSGHKSASDPYFLYAASNVGSMTGLLGYPLVLEPDLRLSVQSQFWSFGYGLFIAMTLICGAFVWRSQAGPVSADVVRPKQAGEIEVGTVWSQRLRWIALAFVPSSLMMAVTTVLTTDVPAIPLFWVLPLGIYLLSFALVFGRRQFISHSWIVRTAPFLLAVSLIVEVFRLNLPLLVLFPLYLLTLFQVAMVCHGELAAHRPEVSRLTEFYLWISVGGVLGGIFNALIAPVVFSTVLEFPLVLIFAALLRPSPGQSVSNPDEQRKETRNDLLLSSALGAFMVAVMFGLPLMGSLAGRVASVLFFPMLGFAVILCLMFGRRPMRLAAALAVIFAVSLLSAGAYGRAIWTGRNFFGVLRVTNSPNGKFRYLIHGGVLHGSQSLDAAESREPLTYYAKSGPAGGILRALHAKTLYGSRGDLRKPNWAVVGLGAGAMACYLKQGESLTYYEINPAVKDIALNPRYFTFLEQCAPAAQIVPGDARLKVLDAADGSYDLIVLDAFSGDMIPMHLITREALALYLRKLAPGGILAFHVSNRYLNLEPTLGALGHAAGLLCLKDNDGATQAESDAGKASSQWMVMARSRDDLGLLGTDARWKPAEVPARAAVWTDDYSNLLDIIRWK